MRIDAMQFAGLDQRGEHGPVFCPFIRTGEECVFSVESNRAHAALDGIGVDLDASIIEEVQQPVPLIEAVANGLAVDEPLGSCGSVFSSRLFKASMSGLDFCCRIARRASASSPRISASIW